MMQLCNRSIQSIFLYFLAITTLLSQNNDIPAFTSDSLLATPIDAWITNGGTLYNQRYSPLSEISTQTIESLEGVWMTHLNGSGIGARFSGEAQPLFYDGVIYVITGEDDVFAIAIETGEIIWTYEANLFDGIEGICCGWTSRGVGMGDNKIFVGQLDGKLLALDKDSGEVVWSMLAEVWEDGYSITSAPLYFNGQVITGFAGGENGIQGKVKSYDATTGDLLWTFNTIPNPGEFGHDTWPQDSDVYKYGGAPVWQTPAIDPELNLIYFSTGNPGPDFGGSMRPGDNLFANSIVAIDALTGQYRWHFQQVHHDIWDYDAPNPVVLFDIDINGEPKKGLAQASKTGWVYILDRITGKPLIGIEERPVPQEPRQFTSPTQPYPIGDAFVPQSIDIAPEGYPELINQGRIFTPFWTEGAVIKPSHNGGANWPPSSYNPLSGTLYVCATDRMSFFRGGEPEEIPLAPPSRTGDRYLGGRFGAVANFISGVFVAMDMRTNKIIWQQRWADRCYSGSTTTAGGLTFVGRNDGRLTALESHTGDLLWEFQTGAGMNTPVTSIEYKDKQYLIAYAAGNTFAGSEKGDNLWLFAIDGGITDLSMAEQANDTDAIDLTKINLINGESLYASACSFCHGENGEGGHGGGIPLEDASNINFVVSRISDGMNAMPGFSSVLSNEEILDVAAYVSQELALD
jgi:quinohemoprotein ethanol dehydrogenase